MWECQQHLIRQLLLDHLLQFPYTAVVLVTILPKIVICVRLLRFEQLLQNSLFLPFHALHVEDLVELRLLTFRQQFHELLDERLSGLDGRHDDLQDHFRLSHAFVHHFSVRSRRRPINLRAYGRQIQQDRLQHVGVQQQLLCALCVDWLTFVDVLHEFRYERIREFYAKLRKVFARVR